MTLPILLVALCLYPASAMAGEIPPPASTLVTPPGRVPLPPLPPLRDHTGAITFDLGLYQGKPLIINAFYEY